jgi:3'-phosphoadenosine 5'-phosphosulfate sulfotransferase (PAPS reductase)/FAD synthetase
MPRKKQSYWQSGPSLWDFLEAPQDLHRPLTDAEKYLYVDQGRGIKIPRAQHYFRLPSADLPPDCQLTSEEVAALRGRALRSQSDLLLHVGTTEHEYTQAFVLFSGGNDSALAAMFTMRFFQKNSYLGPAKILHLDTGTGVAEAQQYVRELAAEQGYPLEVYKTDASYDKLVCQYGFPGPAAHRAMFGMLKKRPLRAAIADHTYSEKKRVAVWLEILHLYCDLVGLRAKDQLLRDYELREKEVLGLYMNVISHFPGTFAQQLFLLECLKQEETFFQQESSQKVLLVTGVRERESRRRMGIMKPLSEEGRMTWLAPFFDWDAEDVRNWMESAGIRTSPVYPFLHRSGECNCGSFAVKGELGELLLWYPECGNHIVELQEQVWKAGFHWGWEDRPPQDYLLHRKGQQYLPEFERGEEDVPNYLCSSCEFYHEQRQSQVASSCTVPRKEAA